MKRIANSIFVFLVFLTSCGEMNQKPGDTVLKTRMDTVSYIIGLDYGTSIRNENIHATKAAVYKGLSDGLDSTSLLSDSVKNKIIDEFNAELEKINKKKADETLIRTKKAGAVFMKENMEKEGVIILPSALQYKIYKEGTGRHPIESDSVLVHYRAMFIDGTVFDMSYDRGPAGIKLNKVIKGLSGGIRQMQTGAIFEFYIPPQLAYGDQPFAKIIPAGTTLVYSVELIKIFDKK